MTATFHDLARLLSERMINGVALGVLLLFFAWALLRIARRQNSSTRFAVWFAVLLGIAALPFAGRLSRNTVGLDAASPGSFTISLPASWAVPLVLAWAAIATLGLLRLVIGLIRLRRVRRHAVPFDFPADPVLLETLQTFRSPRKVRLCVSNQQRVPAAVGFFRPLIVFPSWAVHELSPAELNSILIHELAHLHRWDDWTNLVQKVLRALLFFHPAVWWVEDQLSLEREMACDDVVLSRTSNARAYAECLVSMAERTFLQRTLALTQAAVSRMRQTSRRVAKILDANRPGATQVWKPALALVATFAVICGISQWNAPELVAFRDTEVALPTLAASPSPYPDARLASLKKNAFESAPKEGRTTHVAGLAQPRKSSRSTIRPKAIEAKLNRLATPALETARLSGNLPVAQTMLVVFHQQQYGQFGVQWTVLVWQVNVQRPVETLPPSKKT